MNVPLVKTPIAIVGMACRLPGADGLAAYWDMLLHGRDMATDMPAERIDRHLYYCAEKGERGRTYSTRGALLTERPLHRQGYPFTNEDLQNFDLCHLILCETAISAVKHAGYDPFHMPQQKTGVYVGHSGGSPLGGDVAYSTLAEETVDYLRDIPSFQQLPQAVQQQVMQAIVQQIRGKRRHRELGGTPEIGSHGVAQLVAKVLQLSGPQLAIDAACASSLVALALGMLALEQGEIDCAIIGGASFNKCDSLILFSHAQSCTADRSRPFDNAADGLLSSEGYVSLVLKTLPQALAAGDKIQAVIRGIGISSDGRGKSLWAPRKEGQVVAMQRAYTDGVEVQRVGYVEAHATSTHLGDATEVSALHEFFAAAKLPHKIPVGSVKSNIGHTLETAGLAGLVKTVLAMQHATIPPSINVQELNNEIDWNSLSFQVARTAMPWPRQAEHLPRRGAVNAFGIGGLNVHVVVDEFDPREWTKPLAESAEPLEPIAIIGRGVILPGATSITELQQLIQSGRSQIITAPQTRWRQQIGVKAGAAAPFHTPHAQGGYLTKYEYDWRKHKIPPKQVSQANPLQFMLLDATRQALDEAGVETHKFDHTRTAVVVGSAFGSEFGHQLQVGLRIPELQQQVTQQLTALGMNAAEIEEITQQLAEKILASKPALLDETGSFTASTLASRITKTLNFMGGAMAIDTSHCSSMAALDAACALLRSNSCEQVICAGASRAMDLPSFELWSLRGSLAGGSEKPNAFMGAYYPGEGVAVVFLKRLNAAQRDGNKIYGVIQNVTAQQIVSEAHTTPAIYNDPLLKQIGHTQSAQGLVSVVSATVTMAQPTTTIRTVTDYGLQYTAQLGVSLRETPTVPVPVKSASIMPASTPMVTIGTMSSQPRLIRFSATDISSLVQKLHDSRQKLHEIFHAHSHYVPTDRYRLAIVASEEQNLQTKLDIAKQMLPQVQNRAALEEQGIYWGEKNNLPTRVAFLFPGQGSQYPEMLRGLLEISPAARDVLQQANDWLQRNTNETFATLAWGDASRLGHDVWTTQAAMLVADALMLAALRERGIHPQVVCGHSYGEFAALLAAQSWSLEQALRVTVVRANAINASRLGQGGLLSVDASAQRVAELIAQHKCQIYVTHYNAPQQTVVGGDHRSLAEFTALLTAEGMNSRSLAVPSPFHTPLLTDTQPALAEALSREALLPPCVPLLSSVTNRYVAEPSEVRANLVAQMIEPVRYCQLIERLASEGVNIFVEVGPQQVLTRLARQVLAGRDMLFIPTDHPKRKAEEMLLRVQAALETTGVVENVASPERHASTKVITLHDVEVFDATTRRREKHKYGTVPTPALRREPQHVAPLEQFDATQTRRETKRQAHVTPVPVVPQNAAATQPPQHPIAVASVVAAPVVATTERPAQLERFLIDFVVEQTGYPAEMIDLDWDMEADLGIDSIKRAQLFGELREFFDFETPGKGGLSLDRFRSLRQVLDFLDNVPGKGEWLSTAQTPAPASTPAASIVTSPVAPVNAPITSANPVASGVGAAAELEPFLIRFVVEQTGYPPEIVELDADLEADLGIDSIKKAQMFGELREHFELPLEKMGRLKLADYRTLRQIMEVLLQYLPAENVATIATPAAELVSVVASPEFEAGKEQGVAQAAVMQSWLETSADATPPDNWIAAIPPATTHEVNEFIRGQAVGAGVHVANVLAFERYAHEQSSGNGNGHGKHAEPQASVDSVPETIACRYVLRMVAAPQKATTANQPQWHGAAVILGNNAVGQAIKARLEQQGCRVHVITPTQDCLSAANTLEQLWQQGPICHLFIVTPRDAAAATTLDGTAWRQSRTHGLLTPFWLCQRWLKLLTEAELMDKATLAATVSLGGDFGLSGQVVAAESGAICGLLKAIIIESWVNGYRTLPVKMIDAPVETSPETIVSTLWNELAVPSYDCEIGIVHGERHVIRANKQPLRVQAAPNIRFGAVWVCTGGARGITAFVAKELGQRFGLKLQLIGTAPVPNIPPAWRTLDDSGLKALKLQVMQQARMDGKNPIKAWQNTEKAMEIDQTLREFASLGIAANYYSCDVSNRSALAQVLDKIRNQIGPIEGILHGAGVGKDSRFDRKDPEKVDQCFAAKIDGALALMDLTRRDPIKHFIGFGSISGRFGANGHTDYSAANDMLCKLIDWYRVQRPKTHAVAFHWHAWGDVGMATKPETKLALEMVDMQFMPAQEGLQHLLRELAAGTPEGEVLITDDRYHRMFYPAETLSSGAEVCNKYPLLDGNLTDSTTGSQTTVIPLDPQAEPVWVQHRLEDKPLLPVVVGMEMLAEAARKAAGSGIVVALNQVQAVNGLRFFTERSQPVQVIATELKPGMFACNLTADFHSRDGRLIESQRPYLQGTLEVASTPLTLTRPAPVVSETDWKPVEYAARGEKFYLGPPLRALKQIKLGNKVLWGKVYPPMLQELAGRRRSAEGWIIPSAALDASLYAVGLLAWMQVRPGASLPFRFGKIALGRLPHPGEACLVEARFVKQEERYADFDFTLFGSNGQIIFEVTDYRIVYLQ